MRPKISSWKEIINIRAKISWIELKKNNTKN
jgi:hypothetical protein